MQLYAKEFRQFVDRIVLIERMKQRRARQDSFEF